MKTPKIVIAGVVLCALALLALPASAAALQGIGDGADHPPGPAGTDGNPATTASAYQYGNASEAPAPDGMQFGPVSADQPGHFGTLAQDRLSDCTGDGIPDRIRNRTCENDCDGSGPVPESAS
jgi:hypothetical protein